MDEIRVFYTPQPSHGHASSIPCPEFRSELYSIAEQFDVVWHDGLYAHEGQHRDYAYDACVGAGADIILVVDADELWLPEQLKWVLGYVRCKNPRNWCVNMLHFWRSLGWVCRDNMWPERIIMERQALPKQLDTRHLSPLKCRPLHMGYAVSLETMQYKMPIHGHTQLFRPGWFEEKYAGWKPGVVDVHPTDYPDVWTPEPFDKSSIEDLLGDHPYFHLETIA